MKDEGSPELQNVVLRRLEYTEATICFAMHRKNIIFFYQLIIFCLTTLDVFQV